LFSLSGADERHSGGSKNVSLGLFVTTQLFHRFAEILGNCIKQTEEIELFQVKWFKRSSPNLEVLFAVELTQYHLIHSKRREVYNMEKLID